MSEKNEKILDVANYMIKNEATVANTAKHFKMSTSSIKKYINDDDKLPSIDYSTYIIVKEMQKKLEKIGRIKGGETGKRTTSITKEEIISIARQIINNGWTIEEASYKLNIPSSTIYDRIRNIQDIELQNELDELFFENKRGR